MKKRIVRLLLLMFLFLNIMAAFHAYKFTHFGSEKNTLTQNPEKLGVVDKISALVFGVSLPRPVNSRPSKMAGIRTDNASEYFVL